MGHAHIDTAWLWPYDETVRKITRTLASQLSIAERDTQRAHSTRATFSLSQVHQMATVAETSPGLFARLQSAVKTGAVEIVGSTWVEMDGNVPSTESFCRQFSHGQRWIAKHLTGGVPCNVLWLPDTFGYSGSLPQIARLCGVTGFVSNKLSWNQHNRFPFHTFAWRSIGNGHAVMAHFSPVEDYNALVNPQELGKAGDAIRGELFHGSA